MQISAIIKRIDVNSVVKISMPKHNSLHSFIAPRGASCVLIFMVAKHVGEASQEDFYSFQS